MNASPSPADSHSGDARLLSISEAASATGLSRKALARRIERGTIRSVKDSAGRHAIPRGELLRAGLLSPDGSPVHPGGELVQWQRMYENERQERELAQQRAHELELELVAIANAGPIRAYRLRKQLRSKQT